MVASVSISRDMGIDNMKLDRNLGILENQSACSSPSLTLFPQSGMNVLILIFMLVKTVAYFISPSLGSRLEYFQFPDGWSHKHYLCVTETYMQNIMIGHHHSCPQIITNFTFMGGSFKMLYIIPHIYSHHVIIMCKIQHQFWKDPKYYNPDSSPI